MFTYSAICSHATRLHTPNSKLSAPNSKIQICISKHHTPHSRLFCIIVSLHCLDCYKWPQYHGWVKASSWKYKVSDLSCCRGQAQNVPLSDLTNKKTGEMKQLNINHLLYTSRSMGGVLFNCFIRSLIQK